MFFYALAGKGMGKFKLTYTISIVYGIFCEQVLMWMQPQNMELELLEFQQMALEMPAHVLRWQYIWFWDSYESK